jgi:hypothetical protein
VEILLAKPKDWNGKPGPAAGRMRPNYLDKNSRAFILAAKGYAFCRWLFLW